MPYDPYAGGYQTPSWYQPMPGGWGQQRNWWESIPFDWQTRNLIGFLNGILPLMRSQEDMLAAARELGTLTRGAEPFGGYAGATSTAGQALPPGSFGPGWQSAVGAISQEEPGAWEPYQRANAALRSWLQGIMGAAGQRGKVPSAPGAAQTTRAQESGFQRELGGLLQGGPAGAEAYAPWLKRLFLPTLGRRIPGTYNWSEEQQRGYVTANPSWY